MENLFKGIFDVEGTTNIELKHFLLCIGISIICGIIIVFCYMIKSRYTFGFLITLALMPAIVGVVIMMVNGNLGAGLAVAGAFSLVRFRSAPGTAKEICAIFIAMCVGLVVGMGYLGYAVLITILLSVFNLLYNLISFKLTNKVQKYKILRITIPEDLDYTDVFTPLLKEYTTEYEQTQVKTTNMGSMFRIKYNIILKKDANEKEMIDKLRCRNGNLEISISNQETSSVEL